MSASLATATNPQSGVVLTNILIAIAVVAAFWFLRRWLGDRLSRGRRERWAEEERLEQERLDRLDAEGRLDPPGGSRTERNG